MAKYDLGFQVSFLTEDGGLDTSGDFKCGKHSWREDPLYMMSLESRQSANKRVAEGRHEEAVANYTEIIMKTRALELETDVIWGDDGKHHVFELRATAYLNLSLCFLKLKQWTNAINTATRSMQGDKEPAQPEEDVLPKEKKAKALFRRAQAHCEGFGCFDKAAEDLRKAKEFSPEDKAIEEMLRKCELAIKKTEKAATKKMTGFLNKAKEVQNGEGIFDDSLRPSEDDLKQVKKPFKEPMKVSEGLWLAPQQEARGNSNTDSTSKEIGPSGIDYEEVGREILEMREGDPKMYKQMREKVKALLEAEADEIEKGGDELAANITQSFAKCAVADHPPTAAVVNTEEDSRIERESANEK